MKWLKMFWVALIDFFRIDYEDTKGDTSTRMLYRKDDSKKRR